MSNMPSDHLDYQINRFTTQIRSLQEHGLWTDAAEVLAAHAHVLLDRLTETDLVSLFAPFPQTLVEQAPTLWYVAGLVYARLRRSKDAFSWLTLAGEHYGSDNAHPERELWICLELARLHYSQDEFHSAQQLVDRASALMAQVDSLAIEHQAFLNFMSASLCGDTGRVAQGIEYARRAAQQYHQQRNYASEFRALLVLSTFCRQAGDYPGTVDALNRAHVCYESGRLESVSFVVLLNAETHLAWYRGNLETALNNAHTWMRFSQGSGFDRQRLYAHWAVGGVSCALGQYELAYGAYETARRIAVEQMPNFTRWVDAQQSWLALLQGRYGEAEELIRRALEPADHGQKMSFQVTLALIELFTGRTQEADARLRESLAYYARSQDRLATCAIVFHLAYLQITQEHYGPNVVRLLRPSLKWLDGCDNAYFPFWWHPVIVSRVAAFLLSVPEYHALARRMFRQSYLGIQGMRALRDAYMRAHSVQRAEIAELLAMLGDPTPALLPADGGDEAERVISTATERGVIKWSMLAALFLHLRTASRRDRDNPTVVAIFLLHIQGAAAGEIAQRLVISRSSVSHALQVVYESFGIPRTEGSRIEQRDALRRAAQERGMIV